MVNYKHLIKIISLICLTSLMSSFAIADNYNKYSKVKIVEGKVATGPNKYLDKSLRDYGMIHGIPAGTLGFAELGVYDPYGVEAIPLTSETEDSAVLATFVDPVFLNFLGMTSDDIDPTLLNVPIQKIKTLNSKDGVTREQLPGIFDSVPLSASIAAPTKPITLGMWKEAKGVAKFSCKGSDRGAIDINMKDLIPNRIYSVWGGIFNTQRGLIEEAMGGAPSAFVSNAKGNAKFHRELNYCPFDFVEEANAQLGWLMVVLHSDHMAYGAIFSPEEAGFVGGTTVHVQLEFHLLGNEVE